jgi:hypothetical protein
MKPAINTRCAKIVSRLTRVINWPSVGLIPSANHPREQIKRLRLATFHRFDLLVCQLPIMRGNVLDINPPIGRKLPMLLKVENVTIHFADCVKGLRA